MRRGYGSLRTLGASLLVLCASAGCRDDSAPGAESTWEGTCIDQDGDGFGFQCDPGPDCDDLNGEVAETCARCRTPGDGCACKTTDLPRDCTVSMSIDSTGSLLCKSGTRYCRDGLWSACEGVVSFRAPPPSAVVTRAIIQPDATVACNVCNPDCYAVEDTLAGDGGGEGGVVPSTSGGITLFSSRGDAGPEVDAGLLDDPGCIPGTAPDFDCDGIPDAFDAFPGTPPFASSHNTIFMDLGPGDAHQESFEVAFYLNTADIYFYLDMTGSMQEERNNLLASLRTGNFMHGGGAGVECADRNFNRDTADEEHLKGEGIAGAIACLIRDSRLGAGWHRDLPFPRPDAAGFAYGPFNFELFQHEQDITDNVDTVFTALNRFATRGGINRPEGGIMGLYALATGSELYLGWDRPGNVRRSTCPAGTWGYACFRDDAVPIVIWMTDAPISNGPTTTQGHLGADRNQYGQTVNQPVNWSLPALNIETGTNSHYTEVTPTNETLATALDVGNINDSFRTYVGSTRTMSSDITSADFGGCDVSRAWSTTQTAPDATFRFRVTDPEPITISTRGSRFNSTLAILDARRSTVTTTVTASSNPLAGSATNLGSLSFPRMVNVTGTTAGAAGSFTRDAVGCLAGTSATDRLGAAVFRFNLASDASQLRIVSDANFPLASALFRGAPGAPATDINLANINIQYGASSTTSGGNSNDQYGYYNVGDMFGQYKRWTNGDTGSANLTANLSALLFQSDLNCAGLAGTTKDAVFDFSLSQATRLRIEGTGNNSLLQAGFDHVIALVQRQTNTHAVAGNISDATAATILPGDVPTGAWSSSQYNGVLGGANNTYLQSEVGPYTILPLALDCTNSAAANNSNQAVFAMDVTSLQSYDFDTSGSAVPTWLSLHSAIADTQQSVTSTNPRDGNTLATPNAQALGALDERSVFVNTATLSSHGSAATDYVTTGAMGCLGLSTNGGSDALYSFTVAAAQTVRVSVASAAGTALSPGTPAFNSYLAVFRGSVNATNRVYGDCFDQLLTNGYDTLDIPVSPGFTYYVAVKSFATGALSSANGAYGLWIRDTTFNTHFLACDYGSQPASVRAAKLTRLLTPGRYYVVVKGGSAGAYQLNVRRTTIADPSLIACDRNGGGTQHSLIERDLPAGGYSLIVRGYGLLNQGTYNLIMRDVNAAPVALGCQYDPNTANVPPAVLTASNLPARDTGGVPIDYYAVMRGNTSTGAYSVRIEDGSLQQNVCAFDNVTMTYTQASPAYTYSTDLNVAEWTGTLPVGDYVAVVKGNDATALGGYQFSIGDRTHFEGSGAFAAQSWLGPAGDGVGGVREALRNRKIRVIMVDSTTGSGDSPTYSDQQMQTIAQATNAVSRDGTPLFFRINSDGSGLGSTVVDAVNELAGNLAMDVGVRLVEAPDSPAPRHFGFQALAVDTVGDLCQPPVDTDNDPAHLPDTHRLCTPGAVPRFKITISNPPPPNNVPPNPSEAHGGYSMRLELIADGQYVVDQIPVFVIPQDVIPQPGDLRFDATGIYEQVIKATGCGPNEKPLWRSLGWQDTLPAGTTITWNMCTADSEAALAGCTLQTLATVHSGGACTTASDCPGGYCTATNVCEFVVGPACSSSSRCGAEASCLNHACAWTTNPLDIRSVVTPSAQGRALARVQVRLESNTDHTQAPTIHAWDLRYVCSAQE